MTVEFWWFAVVGLCLLMYIIFDGYDLGIGSSLIFEPRKERRFAASQVVSRSWDANESWLILMALVLWAGFPQVYGVMLPHLYIPVLLMLFGLILRGMSVELASQRGAPARVWVWLFSVGSLLAAFSQGMLFGATMQAVPLKVGHYAGGPLDFLTPFTAITGLTAILLYMALGYAYLVKMGGPDLRSVSIGRGRVVTVMAAIAIVISAASVGATAAPLNLDTPGRAVPFAILVIIAAVAGFVGYHALRTDRTARPFHALSVATVAGFLAYVWARYPMMLPPDLTVHNTIAPPTTMIFLLIGVGLNIPLVLFYTWFAHHAFGGRIIASPEKEAAMHPEGASR